MYSMSHDECERSMCAIVVEVEVGLLNGDKNFVLPPCHSSHRFIAKEDLY